MKMFDPAAPHRTEAHARVYAAYELIYTVVDFAAATLFVFGSIFFFWESTVFAATWMFVVGSCCFALKPTLRLFREISYLRLGNIEELERRGADEI